MVRIYPEWLPTGYYLQEDTAILYLMREDGSTVAAFSTLGFTREGIIEVVAKDRWGRS